jgi:hypothetical protein
MENKRGQELSITALLLIVLGIVVVVVIILGFYKGWDSIFGKFDFFPSQEGSLAKACEQYADNSIELKTDYCTYRNVGSNKYLNCLGVTLDPKFVKSDWCTSKSYENSTCTSLLLKEFSPSKDTLTPEKCKKSVEKITINGASAYNVCADYCSESNLKALYPSVK